MKWMIILILLVLVEMTMGQTKDSWKGRGNTDRKIDGLEIERREAMGFGVVHINGEKMEPVHFPSYILCGRLIKKKWNGEGQNSSRKCFLPGCSIA